MSVHWINKVEVARRQIAEAVRLFFGERDVVAIHTVIASAHQILFDLGGNKGIASIVKNPVHGAGFHDYMKEINYPYNFFKHADRDSEEKINIEPLQRFSGDFIMDAISMLQQIAGDIPIEAKAFWVWFVSKYPEEFDNLPQQSEIRKMQELRLADWDFPRIHKFLEFAEIVGEDQPAGDV